MTINQLTAEDVCNFNQTCQDLDIYDAPTKAPINETERIREEIALKNECLEEWEKKGAFDL